MRGKVGSDIKQNLRDPEFAKEFGAAQAKSSFAITLAKARKELNLTQEQLAARLGVSQAYVAKLEGGEANPTLERIGSLLAVLGLSLTTGTIPLSPYSGASISESDSAVDKLAYHGQKEKRRDIMIVRERVAKRK